MGKDGPDELICVESIGTLTAHPQYWRLIYGQCGHAQEFSRVGLQEPEAAVREVRRHYATCLTCRLEASRQHQEPPALAT